SPSTETLAVSAGNDATGWTGSVYLFERHGQRYRETQKLETGVPGGVFGEGVEVKGRMLVVGASSEDGGRGAAYVYHNVNGDWILQERLTPPDVPGLDVFAFGNAIAIGGGHAAIAAHFSGVVFSYHECGTGLCPEFASAPTGFAGQEVAIENHML